MTAPQPPKVRLILDGNTVMDSTGTFQPAQLERAIQALRNPTDPMPGRNVLFACVMDAMTDTTGQLWTVTKTAIPGGGFTYNLTTKA